MVSPVNQSAHVDDPTTCRLGEVRKTLETPLPIGSWSQHEFRFDWKRAPEVGRFEWLVDGQQVWAVDALNMLDDGLPHGFGLYNYRRLSSWDAAVAFGPVEVGPG